MPRLREQVRRREEGFERLFTRLQIQAACTIVETGSVRQDGWIDGRATVLFDRGRKGVRNEWHELKGNSGNGMNLSRNCLCGKLLI